MTKGCGAEGGQQKCLVKRVGYCLGVCCVFVGGGWLFGLPQVVFSAFPVQYPQRVGLSFVVGI